jgi:hypothetical protein
MLVDVLELSCPLECARGNRPSVLEFDGHGRETVAVVSVVQTGIECFRQPFRIELDDLAEDGRRRARIESRSCAGLPSSP